MADVVVPAAGWEKEQPGPLDDRLMLADLFGPAPRWVVDLTTEARLQQSDLRMHPREYMKLLTAEWIRCLIPFPGALDHLHGVPIVLDRDVPEGVVRVTDRRPASDWLRYSGA